MGPIVRKSMGAAVAAGALLAAFAGAAAAQTGDLVRVDHYVKTRSTAPAMAGQDALIYVSEVARPGSMLRSKPGAAPVVLFVHGAGTPAEVAFDVPYKDYSWMAYLAEAGFDVFAMDMTGYGRSTRPPAMADACNAPRASQAQFVPGVIAAPCAASFPRAITTMSSDFDDIGAVVDRLRALRGVDKVSIVAWSQGGPRSAGYAARNPDKVSRLVVLAPAYNRAAPSGPPAVTPASEGPLTTQSRAEFDANWDRQLGCADQVEPGVAPVVWSEMLASDPVGATWGPGVRRAPQVPSWGLNQEIAARIQTPFLMVAGIHDKQVAPERVAELYADLGARQKVMIDLGCSSHNAMWEKNHRLLFKASLEWLRDGKVGDAAAGVVKLGY